MWPLLDEPGTSAREGSGVDGVPIAAVLASETRLCSVDACGDAVLATSLTGAKSVGEGQIGVEWSVSGNENGIDGTSDGSGDVPAVSGTPLDETRHATAVRDEAVPAATSFGATSTGGGEIVGNAAVGRDESERVFLASGAGAMDCWPDDATEAGIPRRTRFSTSAISVSESKSAVLSSALGRPSGGPDRSIVGDLEDVQA